MNLYPRAFVEYRIRHWQRKFDDGIKYGSFPSTLRRYRKYRERWEAKLGNK